jgi:hypothetical protein
MVKGWASFIFSAGIADYAMISGTYAAVIFFVGWYKKKKAW